MDSDSDDSFLAMDIGLSKRNTRGRRKSATPRFDLDSVMNDADASLNIKQGSISKIIAANRKNSEVLDDALIAEIRALGHIEQKPSSDSLAEELPEGYDATFSTEEHKEILEGVELHGSYAVKGLQGTLLFEYVEELFFMSKDQCIQQLAESLSEETKLHKKLRLIIKHGLLLQFLESDRFRELCKSDSVDFMSEWLIKTSASAGFDELRELGCVSHQLLIQGTIGSINLSSSSLQGCLSCWTLSHDTSYGYSETGGMSDNALGLKNIISIYEHRLRTVEVEEGKDCIRRLAQLGLTAQCRVSTLMGRMVSTAHMTSISEPWGESFCKSLLSDAYTWGSRISPATAWLAVSRVAKLFPISADNSDHLAFAAKLTELAIEKCLSETSVETENLTPGADRVLEKLRQGQHPKALKTVLYSFLDISLRLEVYSNSPALCKASLECITHLFRIGLLQFGCDANEAALVLLPYINLLMPHVEKITKEISRKGTHAEFQRCEMILKYFLRYWTRMQERANEKSETPRTQAKLSAFFSPSTSS